MGTGLTPLYKHVLRTGKCNMKSAIATSLAASSFPSPAMATVPGAVFSVWHNISGAVLAGYYSRRPVKEPSEEDYE